MKKSEVLAALALVVVVAATVLPVATVAVAARPPDFTYQEDVTSRFVKSLGTFSVTVYKLANKLSMYYDSTSQCWSLTSGSAGNKCYWMELTAKNGSGAKGRYVSTLCGIPGSQTWKLLSFNTTN